MKGRRILVTFFLLGLFFEILLSLILKWNYAPEVWTEGGITYLRFPTERLQELPEEPDWEKLESFEIFERDRQNQELKQKINNFIQEEIERSGVEEFTYVNESGDIMISEPVCIESKLYDSSSSVYYRSKGNNLVLVDAEFWGETTSISRIEYHTRTERMDGWSSKKYVCSNEPINDHWYYDEGSLYYIIKCKEDWNKIKVTEGKLINGYSITVKDKVIYPIIEKEGELYMYIVEDTIPYQYAYYVEQEPKIKEMNFKEIEGICQIDEDIFGGSYIDAKTKDYEINIDIILPDTLKIGDKKTLKECLQEIESFRYSGYGDGKTFMYWKKNGDADFFF